MIDRDREKNPYQQDSLEQFSSPEQLDQLMKVIRPVDWLMLSTCAGFVAIGLVWSILGRIPVTIEGRGVLMQPRQIVEFQSNVAGQLQALKVDAGECVQKNQILATIKPLDLQQQLQLAQAKRGQLETQSQNSLTLSNQRLITERQAIAASRTSLEQRLKDNRALTPVLRTRGMDALQEQRRSLEQQLKNARSLLPIMEKRLAERQRLQEQGAISQDSILQVQQEYIHAQEAIADLEAQLKTLEVQSTETEQKYLENLSQVGELEAQLQALDSRAIQFDQENLDASTQNARELQEVNRDITRLEQQIEINSQILSSQAGCILEMNAEVGQVIQPGTPLGHLQITEQNPSIKGISYLAVKDGKRVKQGMTILITPDTVQKERFGGIVGQVVKVSSLPISREGILATVGNAEIAQTLLGTNGAVIAVEAELEADRTTASGYKWSSSQGTPEPITSGTTTTVRITLEERAPITFVLPFLQELSGMN